MRPYNHDSHTGQQMNSLVYRLTCWSTDNWSADKVTGLQINTLVNTGNCIFTRLQINMPEHCQARSAKKF